MKCCSSCSLLRWAGCPWLAFHLDAAQDDFHGMQYEPELFPGLIYRMKEPKVVLLIFVSGKVVLTGVHLDVVTSGISLYTWPAFNV